MVGTERLDRTVICVMDGNCGHSKRAVQERWESTCLELTLCNHEFHPYRERLRVCLKTCVAHMLKVWRTQGREEVARDQV